MLSRFNLLQFGLGKWHGLLFPNHFRFGFEFLNGYLFCAISLFFLSLSGAAQQQSGSDVDLSQFESIAQPLIPREKLEDRQPAFLSELMDAYVDQYNNQRSVSTLRSLQRAYRKSEDAGAACLGEILTATNNLRLRNEFIRFAELGSKNLLVGEKIALRAAVVLTDSRKYSAAARYYERWLRIKTNEPESYLSVIVLIEKGRLHYLAREYSEAKSDFDQVLRILNSDLLDDMQKKQILRNSDTTYRMMANTYLKTNEFDLARKLFDLAGIDSSSPIRFLNEANIAFGEKRFDEANALVHQFIAKQPNNSESYLLLRKLYLQKPPSSEVDADKEFVSDLERIRQKFRTGKVLDDFLINYYLKLDRTEAAKKILIRRRNETLYRDRANRALIDIAFRENNFNDLFQGVVIEVDEHESISAIRQTLKANQTRLVSWSDQIEARHGKNESVVVRLAAACLMLHQDEKEAEKIDTKDLIEMISRDNQSSRLQAIRLLTLFGREAVSKRQYPIALACFQRCLVLNQSNKKWLDQRTAFDSLLSSVFVHSRMEQQDQAMIRLAEAEKVLRYSPSLMHLKGWTKLQFCDLKGAIVDYDAFLARFDKSGATQSLSTLIERVRLEMAFAFFLLKKKSLAAELINQILDRNPIGPDLDAFQRNNQKYTKQKKLFLEFANGVKNGGPFTLGRN